MSVGILLVTHNAIGEQLLGTAKATLGFCPVQTSCLAVAQDVDPDSMEKEALGLLQQLDTGEGVLVLTDAYGSTPSNVASRLAQRERICVIAGVNLPMLLRVFNYPRLSLQELANKAVTGGQDGVVLVQASQHAS